LLDGIDSIDWASLGHAYGSAQDVPALIRALASSDEDRRKQALYELYGNIWHQGTVYPATAAAVPFLYELLKAPDVPAKSDIAGLLAAIAAGRGYLEVHAVDDRGEKAWRKILKEKGKSLQEEINREANETRSVRRAVAQQLLDLLPYLRDPEAQYRRAVAQAFALYPEYKDTTLPALGVAAKVETEEEVKKALAASIAHLQKEHGP
jgi:hypothetical protein